MAQSLARRGYLELFSAEVGPPRKVRIISFPGRSDTGLISQGAFRARENPVAIVNVSTGALATTSFITTVETGGISQSDTGLDGEIFFAIVTDTGAAGLS